MTVDRSHMHPSRGRPREELAGQPDGWFIWLGELGVRVARTWKRSTSRAMGFLTKIGRQVIQAGADDALTTYEHSFSILTAMRGELFDASSEFIARLVKFLRCIAKRREL